MSTEPEPRAFKKTVAVTPHAASLLARIPDVTIRRSLTRLAAEVADLLNAVHALDGLSRELPRHSLELRERLTAAWPLARAALQSGERLLVALRETFPKPPEKPDDLDFDAAFGDASAAPPPADPQAGLRALEWAIAHELDRVRPALLRPAPIDPDASWRALVELQEFRGRVRNAVGELVFEAFRAHAAISREDVIPGYSEELAESLALRRAVATLSRRVIPLCLRVKLAGRLDLGKAVVELAQAVGAFCASPAFTSLRLADRRTTQGFGKRLGHLADSPAPAPARDLAEDLARFVESLAAISRREMLVLHDRTVVQTCRAHLQPLVALDPNVPLRSSEPFFLALHLVRSLEGADSELDTFLAYADGWADHQPPEGVRTAAGELLALLDALSPGSAPRVPSAWDPTT